MQALIRPPSEEGGGKGQLQDATFFNGRGAIYMRQKGSKKKTKVKNVNK